MNDVQGPLMTGHAQFECERRCFKDSWTYTTA